MKRLFVLSCFLSLSASASIASATPKIHFWHRHKKDPAASAPAPKQKAKHNLFHRAQPTREESARSETAYGMTGPRSVGYLHPQPGPAGVGAQ
jgi:hypothetical protein